MNHVSIKTGLKRLGLCLFSVPYGLAALATLILLRVPLRLLSQMPGNRRLFYSHGWIRVTWGLTLLSCSAVLAKYLVPHTLTFLLPAGYLTFLLVLPILHRFPRGGHTVATVGPCSNKCGWHLWLPFPTLSKSVGEQLARDIAELLIEAELNGVTEITLDTPILSLAQTREAQVTRFNEVVKDERLKQWEVLDLKDKPCGWFNAIAFSGPYWYWLVLNGTKINSWRPWEMRSGKVVLRRKPS